MIDEDGGCKKNKLRETFTVNRNLYTEELLVDGLYCISRMMYNEY
ncbi:MAG: hypothetical protein PHI27_06365 [Eubacteriales bacterium]|nr:hypothetical protein [Eubacteriales bacterium]MDD4512897.1 hypothetical protein [Eubacteriales bacterium]